MILEIEGAGFSNKGAELMLRSVLHEVRGWGDVRCVVRPSRGSYEQRAVLALWQRVDLSRLGPVASRVRRSIPSSYRRRYGLIIPEEIDAVLDASGFRYSDQWGSATSEGLARRARAAAHAGARYILMPQAFGPFEGEVGREAFRRASEDVQLIFARDVDSLEHVRNVIGDDPRLHLAPDFTAALPAISPERDLIDGEAAGLAAIIPNARMLDKTTDSAGEGYITFMRRAVEEVVAHGHRPVVVLHSADVDDLAVAREIVGVTDPAIRIVEENDPQKLKGVIAGCDLVIGSRFHGLVNALSQGVPSVATGWSHKYRRLFEAYGCEDLLVDVSGPLDDALARVRRLLEPEERAEVRRSLSEANVRIGEEIRRMWAKVREAVHDAPGARA